MTNINIENCHELLSWMQEKVKNIVILTHANPDGDALGSSLGLNCLLRNAGFNSTIVFPTGFPQIVPGLKDYTDWVIFERNERKVEQLFSRADLFFMLDFNDLKRLGKLKSKVESLTKMVVLIDHHPQTMIVTPYLFSDTRVSSTAELVYDFIVKMGWENLIDAPAATALLTGIIADTASFSHNAKRSELYKATANLIAHGADQYRIQEALFNTNTEGRLRLLGFALSEKMEIFPQYHAAVIVLSGDELKRYNFKIGDTEGFVNYPLSIKGIIFSCLFIENEDKIKISFRSKGGFAVNELSASYFSGGGHLNAAGGESRKSLREAVKDLIDLLPKYAGMLEIESIKDA
ncbi:MAG TPA: bifunctional oligoribonuclease/PAP phosphatase NrnA [Prolixibacteraceae bacterium]